MIINHITIDLGVCRINININIHQTFIHVYLIKSKP